MWLERLATAERRCYVEGASGPEPMPTRRGEWPGEWTIQYGWKGIRDHATVLARGATLTPATGPVKFADLPKSSNSVVWDVLPEQDAYTIGLHGHETERFSYRPEPSRTRNLRPGNDNWPRPRRL